MYSHRAANFAFWQFNLCPYNTLLTMTTKTFPNSPYILHQPVEPAG